MVQTLNRDVFFCSFDKATWGCTYNSFPNFPESQSKDDYFVKWWTLSQYTYRRLAFSRCMHSFDSFALFFAFSRGLAFTESFQWAPTKYRSVWSWFGELKGPMTLLNLYCQTLPVSQYILCHAEMWAPNKCRYASAPRVSSTEYKKSTGLTDLDSSDRKQLELHAPYARNHQS